MYKKTIAVIALAALAGCVSPKYNYLPAVSNVAEPPVGSVNTARIGDKLLAYGTFAESEGIRVSTPIDVGLHYTINQGLFVKVGQDAQSDFVKPATGSAGGSINKGMLADPWQVIQAYKDGRKICVVTVFNASTCTADGRFEYVKIAADDQLNFQQTLIYSGRVGDKIKLGYREFSNSQARPAFNNEVEYDLSQSTQIGYKGAKLKILEANNEFVRYEVLKNFD